MVALLLHREVVAEWGVLVLFVAVRGAAPHLDLDVALLVFVVVALGLVDHDEGGKRQHEQTGEQCELDFGRKSSLLISGCSTESSRVCPVKLTFIVVRLKLLLLCNV